MAGEEGPRKVRLFCPSVKKMIDWVASNDQRLDFGSIAAAFGLEPSTVKLNGHFVSRGIDLVASCVTWRSLLAFFSAKGLSTGKDDGDALVVDGKLSKVRAKRPHYHLQDTTCSSLPGNDLGLFRSKKLRKDQDSGTQELCSPMLSGCLDMLLNKSTIEGEAAPLSRPNGLGFKRKQLPEDGDSLKKIKTQHRCQLK